MKKFEDLRLPERFSLLKAYVEGGTVQTKRNFYDPWVNVVNPVFKDDVYYRIAPDDLYFGKLDRSEQLEIIEAYLDDKTVQVRFSVVGEWYPLAKLDKSADINLPFKFTNYYRIKK